jgi:hypothetical protein
MATTDVENNSPTNEDSNIEQENGENHPIEFSKNEVRTLSIYSDHCTINMLRIDA